MAEGTKRDQMTGRNLSLPMLTPREAKKLDTWLTELIQVAEDAAALWKEAHKVNPMPMIAANIKYQQNGASMLKFARNLIRQSRKKRRGDPPTSGRDTRRRRN